MKKVSKLGKMYCPTNQSIWTGRKTNPNIEAQYWHQIIQSVDLNNNFLEVHQKNKNFALLGYACDEGVRRNQGRIGAVEGPIALRKSLAKTALHFQSKTIYDLGDIRCIDNKMEDCQKQFSSVISQLVNSKIFPIGLGGGHDMAFAHFMGLQSALKGKNIGIINFDAHFDLRPIEQQSNSGTPFNQINDHLKSINQAFNYLVVGIQRQSNTKTLFNIASDTKTQFIPYNDCHLDQVERIKQVLDTFLKEIDHLYITIDLDGFSSAYVSGVSAPSPLGFAPLFFFETLQHLLLSNKTIACDIAELNPLFDKNNLSANMAAKIVDFIVSTVK